MGSPSRDNGPNWTPQLSAFTSGDAHNGCRALFNGTAGWAYFGPAGEIDEGTLPAGTVSYPYSLKGGKSGSFGMTASGSGSGGGGDGNGASQAAKKPGDDLSRKSNEMRGVYFDAKDLAHLVRGWAGDGDDDDDDDDDDAVQYGGGYCERGGGGEEGEGRPRKGRPIVLTLQAILAATTPTAAAAVVAADAVAAFPLNSKATAAAVAEEGETATDKDGNNYTGAAAAMPAAAATVAGVTAADNNAQFPPLMLRDASAEKGPGLYLAPPIKMVKKNSPGHPAEHLATSHEAAAAAGTQGCAVSCSEAAAATSVAEAAAAAAGDETTADGAAAAAATTGGGGGGAVSRIGWWLRWATSGSGEGGVSPAAELAGGDGLETRSGADGWEVVVSSAPAAAGVAANASGGNDDVASWSDFVEEEDKADTRLGKDGDDDDATEAAPQSVSQNVPRSFRDTLMAGGAAGFSDPKAFSRSRAAAAAASSSSGAASSPTLVDGGEQGGAVFLWRKAAAGQGGRAADRAKSVLEDEDPYYARKRVGAFAHRTKPRGKAHK